MLASTNDVLQMTCDAKRSVTKVQVLPVFEFALFHLCYSGSCGETSILELADKDIFGGGQEMTVELNRRKLAKMQQQWVSPLPAPPLPRPPSLASLPRSPQTCLSPFHVANPIP